MAGFNYGGQALIEGVMMRGRDAIAVAFRHPDGRIVYATERLESGWHGSRWARLPLIRGLVVLYETLVVGTRWLVRSASLQAAGEGVELGAGPVALIHYVTQGPKISQPEPGAGAERRPASRPAPPGGEEGR